MNKNTDQKSTPRAGFMEVLVIIGIVTILLAISIPAFTRAHQRGASPEETAADRSIRDYNQYLEYTGGISQEFNVAKGDSIEIPGYTTKNVFFYELQGGCGGNCATLMFRIEDENKLSLRVGASLKRATLKSPVAYGDVGLMEVIDLPVTLHIRKATVDQITYTIEKDRQR